MFIHDAPYLGLLNGGARLRDSAVRLQHYLDVNPGNKARAAVFWENQKALAANPNGHPADGLFIGTGVRDIRIDCYTVLSAVRMGSAADKALWSEFCNAFIVANGGVTEPLVFSKNLDGDNASDAVGTYIALGSAYDNSVAVSGGKAPYTYQWYRRSGGQDFTVGTNAPTYNIPSYAASNNGDYFVRVTDATGAVIESTRDRVRVAIRLTTNLTATKEVAEAGTLSLAIVAADGLAPYTYQWFKDDVAISGRTAASFSKAAVTAADAGVYHCVATSANTKVPNSITSVKCTVAVTPAA